MLNIRSKFSQRKKLKIEKPKNRKRKIEKTKNCKTDNLQIETFKNRKMKKIANRAIEKLKKNLSRENQKLRN